MDLLAVTIYQALEVYTAKFLKIITAVIFGFAIYRKSLPRGVALFILDSNNMNPADLKDYQADEEEKTREYFNATVDRIVANGGIRPTILDLIPEYKHKIEKKSVTNALCVNPTNEMDVVARLASATKANILQLPFFDSIVFSVLPSKDGKMFEQKHGLKLGYFMRLVKDQKILPVLFEEPINFEGCECMDQILELRPPSFPIRWELLEALQLVSHTRKKIFNPSIISSLRKCISGFPELREAADTLAQAKRSLDDFKSLTLRDRDDWAHAVENLILEGHLDLETQVLKLDDINAIKLSITFNTLVLCGLPTFALNSIESVPEAMISDIQKLKIPTTDLPKVFPIDVSKVLVEKFNLIDFRDIDYDKIPVICKETSKARRALYELDYEVKKRQVERALGRAQALTETLHEANEAIEAIPKRKRQIARWVPMTLGVAGGIVGSLTFPGIGLLTGALGGMIGSLPLSESIAESLAKRRQRSHVVALYELAADTKAK